METTKQEPKLRLLKNEDQKFKLVIPKEMEQKIRIACARLPENEWSGVLFYNVKGSFEKGTLKILCRDFLVMDIGSDKMPILSGVQMQILSPICARKT
jgi:hypothetical protein